jgi:hypothetical protein
MAATVGPARVLANAASLRRSRAESNSSQQQSPQQQQSSLSPQQQQQQSLAQSAKSPLLQPPMGELFIAFDKGSVESYKRQLLEALERDHRLTQFEFPSSTSVRRSATPQQRRASVSAILMHDDPPVPPNLVVVSIEDVITPRTAVSAPTTVFSSPSQGVSSVPPVEVAAAPSSSFPVVDQSPAPSPLPNSQPEPDDCECMRDMYGNGVPEHLETEFLAWYETFVMQSHDSNRTAQLLFDSLEGGDASDDDSAGSADNSPVGTRRSAASATPTRDRARSSSPGNAMRSDIRAFLCTLDAAHDIRQFARSGIAPNWRGRVWALILDLAARQRAAGRNEFAEWSDVVQRELANLDAVDAVHHRVYDQIERDVPRTFPDVVAFHPTFLQRLSKLLCVYSRRNGYGYTQGINFIAGSLLLFFDDKDAFHVLGFICEELLPFYFADGMIGLLADTQLMEMLIAEHLPKLWRHFQQIGLSVLLITSQWFTCLFCKNFPLETTFRIWDLIIIDGGITRMFEFALRTLALFEANLLKIKDDVDLVCSLNLMVESLFDFNKLLAVNLPRPLIAANVQLARVRVRRRLLEQIEAEQRRRQHQQHPKQQ